MTSYEGCEGCRSKKGFRVAEDVAASPDSGSQGERSYHIVEEPGMLDWIAEVEQVLLCLQRRVTIRATTMESLREFSFDDSRRRDVRDVLLQVARVRLPCDAGAVGVVHRRYPDGI